MIVFALALLAAAPVAAQTYVGAPEVIRGDAPPAQAQGVVFRDDDRDSRRDPDEPGLAGVMVSNGREVVATDAQGRYALPARDDMTLFVTRPAGMTPPVDADMVPQFHYAHKPAGSPPLRFGGLAPTGPLPQAVNFPLVPDGVGDAFECLAFGDAQTYSHRELGYLRETVGRLLTGPDAGRPACLLFLGDMMGDDLSLFPRFKRIVAAGGVPQYFVHGNHDLDFDATDDRHSADSFRAAWGPPYYSFDIGRVHFVVLDNVRYPCNGVDDRPFCAAGGPPDYNGVIGERQLAWLRNDLAHVPRDRLIVLAAHIPFVTFTDAASGKHQTDDLAALVAVLDGRPTLGLAGHTHTVEQIMPGEHFAGFEANTGVGPQAFHQIIAGAVSGSWWAGDLNDAGAPHATQRLGAPRGYFRLGFGGPEYVDTFRTFDGDADDQMHASLSTPRFRDWARRLFAFADAYDPSQPATPPVSVNDLGDPNLLTPADLAGGTWLAVNLWNGAGDSRVTVSINGAAPVAATRTQPGAGEAPLGGPDFADPRALARQASQGRVAVASTAGGAATDGFRTWRGAPWRAGVAQPFPGWMLARKSSHLWRADLPAALPPGVHNARITATDRHGRRFTETLAFEVVETLPPLEADTRYWD